jgi:hypothetical protein
LLKCFFCVCTYLGRMWCHGTVHTFFRFRPFLMPNKFGRCLTFAGQLFSLVCM